MPYLAIEHSIFDQVLQNYGKKRLETTETWIGILERLRHGDREEERRGRQDSYYEDCACYETIYKKRCSGQG